MTTLGSSSFNKSKQVCDSRPSSDDVPIGVHSSNETPIDSQDPDYEGVSIDAHEVRISGAKRPRSKTSTIWNDFDEVVINGIKKGKCKYCSALFSISGGSSTSSMRRHKCLTRFADKKQTTLSFKSGVTSDVSKKLMEMGSNIDAQAIRELIAKLVATGEHAFSIVDNCWFRFILRLGFPNWVPVSRTTVKRDVMKLYEEEKKKLLVVFKGVEKIALTTDMWTSNQQLGYLALTAHFIDKDWKMQQRIINFTEVEPPHTGLVLANVIAKHLSEWEIKKKIISITVDNASSNDVLVRKLKENMEKSGINLYHGGKIFHVRCCAHILNIMVQDGLSVIKDEIISIREAVKYIKVSPSRLHGFAAAARELDLSTSKKLVLDVPTRWNSTYFMLERALLYKDAFARYSMEDGLIKHDNNGDPFSFNVLQWWKDKESKYRILSQMARDLLSIPITSVASERAFSTGGRIVSDSRSSLVPKTVEALVCLGNWIKNEGDPMHEVVTQVEDESSEYISLE